MISKLRRIAGNVSEMPSLLCPAWDVGDFEMGQISSEIVGRIKARADDPAVRSQASGMAMSSTNLGSLLNLKAVIGSLPCMEADLKRAEAGLGFKLPSSLRQVYQQVADGRFGPGDGLYGLDVLVAKYHEMTAEPVGPDEQMWPANLLPISGSAWSLTCIDRDNGRLIFWDAEELAEHGRWDASFKPEAESLEAWLSHWADAD